MHSSSRDTDSFPLLRLPGEIREQILLNVVGKQKIHILHVVLVGPERMNKTPWGWRGPYNCSSRLPSGYHHCICLAATNHDKCISEESTSAILPKNVDYESYHQSCRMRQSTWQINMRGETLIQELGWSQINLSILRASRQLYEEANPLSWKTTTFAFTDRNSLEAFFQDLNGIQTASLQHLELSTAQVVSTWYVLNGADRTIDDSLGLIRLDRLSQMLSKIGSLISLSLHLTYWSSSNMVGKTVMTRQISKGLMSAFRVLSRLDVQHINVTVRERADKIPVFTISELEHLASNFREELMAESQVYHTSGKNRLGLESRHSQPQRSADSGQET